MSSNDTKIVNGWDSQAHIISFVVKGHNLQKSEIHFINNFNIDFKNTISFMPSGPICYLGEKELNMGTFLPICTCIHVFRAQKKNLNSSLPLRQVSLKYCSFRASLSLIFNDLVGSQLAWSRASENEKVLPQKENLLDLDSRTALFSSPGVCRVVVSNVNSITVL